MKSQDRRSDGTVARARPWAGGREAAGERQAEGRAAPINTASLLHGLQHADAATREALEKYAGYIALLLPRYPIPHDARVACLSRRLQLVLSSLCT